jgi:glycosyltransferase involved in cell wall biosynthesis
MPLVTVLMSAYNAQNDIAQAVQSILDQSLSDFEFIIINDGSTDETGAILEDFAAKDPRITLIHQENTGLTKALNTGLHQAKGKYIARQDADDVSYPQRLEKQITHMEQTGAILCGANADDVYEDGSKGEWGYHDDFEIGDITFRQTPFPHSTAIMCAQTAKELGGYDETFRTSQDMELWMRFAKRGQITMLKQPLIQRKISANAISRKNRMRQFKDAQRARRIHNQALFKRLHAQYTGWRCLCIESLPRGLIRALKKILK